MEIQPAGTVHQIRLNPGEVTWLARARWEFDPDADFNSRIDAFTLEMAKREVVAATLEFDPEQTPAAIELTMTTDELSLLYRAAHNANIYARFRLEYHDLFVGRTRAWLAKVTEASAAEIEASDFPERVRCADTVDAQTTSGIMEAITAYRAGRAKEA